MTCFIRLKFIIVAIFVFWTNGARAASCDAQGNCENDYKLVTCGSVIKLRHIRSSHRLHSHEVSYGQSGSGQQSVTAVKQVDDTNSLWTVLGTHALPCPAGTPVKNGDAIRLRHVATRKNLHSHLHKSPLSAHQEVSAFDGDPADTGDDWIVVLNNQADLWSRGQSIRLQHRDTNQFLETNARFRYGNPIPGQLEVYCESAKTDNGNWATEEGIYFSADED